ncbi:hypothetical protein HDC36_001680 [Xanthomonas sp. JAI131]|nr:hypothetical protein [Xanthomonas sp. JAI131]
MVDITGPKGAKREIADARARTARRCMESL